MKISELIKNLDTVTVSGSLESDVCDIAYSTKSARKNSCFVAIRGQKADGHEFINEAINKGACLIVSEKAVQISVDVTNVVVKNSRTALAKLSSRFFGEPSKELTLIGVTGTNGKTTITYLLESIFKATGKNPAVLGTVEYRFGKITEPSLHTTPESYDLQKNFVKMKELGLDTCIMEVSSHALSQERVGGCNFDTAIFTNLTPEHLDYHSDMESYFEAKAILFEDILSSSSKRRPFAVINIDDPYGERLAKRCSKQVVSYGFGKNANVRAEGLHFDKDGLSMSICLPDKKMECRSKLCGKFNALNILAAVACAYNLGTDINAILKGVENLSAVPGRFEAVSNDRGILALVDYAHTPDALENALVNAKELLKQNGKLIVVFGCGGDRDRGKRPIMGKIAGKIADVQIVTSDNPRTEEPLAIISEIMTALKGRSHPMKDGVGYEVIPDRREAIKRSVEIAKSGDVVLIAGKGHEDYQIIGTTKHHFDDREELKRIFK